MIVRGINKTSLIDYPGKISAVLYTAGCNLRCSFCYNPDFVYENETLDKFSEEDVISFIRKRKNIIEGVVITGGEPSIHPGLPLFIEKIRAQGLEIKLDTNGFRPDVIEDILNRKLIDYIALDIKTSPEKYQELTNIPAATFNILLQTLDIIKKSGIDYEIRSTCVPGYITAEDIKLIGQETGRIKKYCLQQFLSGIPLVGEDWSGKKPYNIKEIYEFRSLVLDFADECDVRGLS